LGKFKSPDRIHVLDNLPKGPSGKIQRLQLHTMVYGVAP
jgi:acyl-coenzyme A synthetase/AMP-(fatty) acid ligase